MYISIHAIDRKLSDFFHTRVSEGVFKTTRTTEKFQEKNILESISRNLLTSPKNITF